MRGSTRCTARQITGTGAPYAEELELCLSRCENPLTESVNKTVNYEWSCLSQINLAVAFRGTGQAVKLELEPQYGRLSVMQCDLQYRDIDIAIDMSVCE